MNEVIKNGTEHREGGFKGRHVLLIILATILLTVGLTFWFVRTYIYARDFQPVELDVKEQQVLDRKLRTLGFDPSHKAPPENNRLSAETDEQWLRPERYSEKDTKREVQFSERELNAIIAHDQDLAKKLAVDLSTELVSARLLVAVDPDFPLLGGKTLRVSAGVEVAFTNRRPRILLKGVSLMGVPIPGAWLGGLKNIDLIQEFGDSGGFWQAFADGVEHIEVREGELVVKLKP